MAKSIMQAKKECYLTGNTWGLHKHHIYFGSGLRKVSDRNGFWCYLTADMHNMSNEGVHFNHELDLRLKRECQERYEESHSREEFMDLIGRNYL